MNSEKNTTAVASGRDTDDVIRRVAMGGLIYAGNQKRFKSMENEHSMHFFNNSSNQIFTR